MRRSGRRGEQAGPESPEVDPALLELAREIQAEVTRIVEDPDAEGELLEELLDRIPREERQTLARTVFDRLPAERQWDVVARVYGDDEIRAYLDEHRSELLDEARAGSQRADAARRARAAHRLDTDEVAPGEVLTLGLFREHDARAALARGHTSSTCARQLVLRSTGDGWFQVIQDVFNPRGGYFVTAEYSEDTWRDSDRLAPHAEVRVGSIRETDAGASFEPGVYPGGRVDFEVNGHATPGRLHLGFASLSDIDIFKN